MYRMAFAGFQHGHVQALYRSALKKPEITIAAACEPDPEMRRKAEAALGVTFTHDRYESILADDSIGIIAVGDHYGARGALTIAALKAGKHLIADKPICTSLAELHEIRNLADRNHLQIALMLDLRYGAKARPIHDFLQDGKLGDIKAVFFGGQHPLLYGTRPDWYYEPGKHGGTINDIAIHGLDLIAWLTGLRLKRVLAARCWNGFARDVPTFRDCGQFMIELTNGAGLLADVSYASPDSFGFSLPLYWRFTIWGTKGVMEFSWNSPDVRIALEGAGSVVSLPIPEAVPGDWLDDLINAIEGKPTVQNTRSALDSSQDALTIQAQAE
jgi:predicted dehydrogenase